MIDYSIYLWKNPMDEKSVEMAYAKNQLKKVMRVADGVTSFPRFRARIMYVCNKEISMSPSKSTKGTGKKRGKYKKGT